MHTWSFFRAGGFDQVRLDSGADVVALAELDPKLWAALACPVVGVEFDAATLRLVDADADGRIRQPDVVAAARWITSKLKDPDELFAKHGALPLDALRDDDADAARLKASARQILVDLGKPTAVAISVTDTSDLAKVFAARRLNGDGVVPPGSADDAEVAALFRDVIACPGGVLDASGEQGVDKAHLDAFLAAAAARSAWRAASEADAAVLPLGDGTAAGHAALLAVKAKVEDWFARVRLAAFDSRVGDALGRTPDDLAALVARDLVAEDPEVAKLPLARVTTEGRLPLGAGCNPAWAGRLRALRDRVATPLLGERDSLDEASWTSLVAAFAPYEAWLAAEAGKEVASLSPARVTEVLAPALRVKAEAVIAADAALHATASSIQEVDKLVRLHRDLVKLLHNFVAFRDFYTQADKAIFQVGTLYVDQRGSELCLRVDDVGKHAGLATSAGTYLAYCDVTRKATGEHQTIVAAVTGGDADNLMVGRNGLFVDRQGRDWDATIVRIVEHPISLRQAFWSPYKKLAKLIESQVEKFASSKQAEVDASHEAGVASGAQAVVAAPTAPPTAAAPAPAFDVARFAGIFAAIGLAIGAIGGAITGVVSGLAALAWWKLPFVFAGLILAVSGPSMLMAGLKLRKRNLAPLLDASGWAVNANARMNIPFGESLTGIAKLPPGARRTLDDPFAESRRGRVYLGVGAVVGLLAALWWFDVLERVAPWLPDSPRVSLKDLATPTTPAPAEAPPAP